MSAFGLIFLLVGVGALVGAVIAMVRTKGFLGSAREARAEVVRLQERIGTERQRAYYPVLRYRTQEGATQEVVSSVGSNPPRYKEGDTVAILYDPTKPESIRVHTFFNVWGATVILGVVGVVFLIVTGIVAMFSGH